MNTNFTTLLNNSALATGQPVDLRANFQLLGEVQRFGLGYGDMELQFGVNNSGGSAIGSQIGQIGFQPGGIPFASGVLQNVSLKNDGTFTVVNTEFSVPFSLNVGQDASMYVGLGSDENGGSRSGSIQVIFDFSDNVGFVGSILGGTGDEGLTLTSVTLADGTPLADAGLKFDFIPENTVLTAGASAFDNLGLGLVTNTASPPNRAAAFLFPKAAATSKLQGGSDVAGIPTNALVDLDVNPEPDPFVFDLAFATVSGANNIRLTSTTNNSPTVNLSVTPSTGSEAGKTAITVTATAASNVVGDQTVNLNFSGTGITSEDFTGAIPTQITIPNGQSTSSFTINVNDDTLVEGTETATFAISSPSAGIALGSTTSGSVAIEDNDVAPPPTVNLSVTPSTGSEAGQTAIMVTATASSAVAADQAVNLSVTGTGITAGDYTLSNSTITIPSGSTTGSVTFTVANDAIAEGTETATLTISNPSAGITLGATTSQDIAIADDDTAGITVTPTSGLTTTEAGAAATFTVALNSQPTVDANIPLSSSDTTEGTVAPNSLTFTNANWNTPQTVTVTGIDDNIVDGNVAYSIVTGVATSTDPNYSGVDASDVSVTNTDNDVAPPPIVNLSVTPSTGSEAGKTAITLTATAASNVVGDQTMNLNFSGTGITSEDFTGTIPTQITIPNGQSTSSFTINVNDDTLVEGTETATFAISSPSAGIALGNTTSQSVTIADNDSAKLPSVNLSVTPSTGSETCKTAITVKATASSNVVGDQTLNVNLSGMGITPDDFKGTIPAQIKIPNGQSTGSFTVNINDDTLVEGTETAKFTISNLSSGITLGSMSSGSVAITDNDSSRGVINGTDASETLTGTKFADTINGNGGNDILNGLGSDDILNGGNGFDTLNGGDGDDIFDGGRGFDLLNGSAGSDIFVLSRGFGVDTIQDFTDSMDKLGLAGGLTYGQLTINTIAGNTLIRNGFDLLAVLVGVNSNLITAADFVTA